MATMLLALALLALSVLRWRYNGWGSLAWLAAFIAMSAIRAPYAARNRLNVIVVRRRSTIDQMLLIAMFLTMMVLPLLHLATPLLSFANYSLPAWATWTGALAELPFLWLFWRSHADLGRNWSPGLEVREGHGLVTNGVYAVMRHPMYAAIWIASLAQPLLIHNWIAGVLIVPACGALWFLRVPKEEAMMRETFGEAYDDYARKVGRLFL
jgi:protein-S-isoprenylcysteine O-methyltransferase Ste14